MYTVSIVDVGATTYKVLIPYSKSSSPDLIISFLLFSKRGNFIWISISFSASSMYLFILSLNNMSCSKLFLLWSPINNTPLSSSDFLIFFKISSL